MTLFAGCSGTPPDDGSADQDRADATANSSEADTRETDTDTEEAEETEEFVDPDPVQYDGTGDSVQEVDVHDDPRIARISHTGARNFAVWSVDPSGDTTDLLVNEIGTYEGAVLYNAEVDDTVAAFEITADGEWSIALDPLSTAETWSDSTITGHGDDVVRVGWEIDGLATADIVHSGSSNFAIWAYEEQGRDLLVNEIGAYEGEALLSTEYVLFAITADGEWSLSY